MHPQPLRLLEPILEPAVAEFVRLALLGVSAVCVAWIALAIVMAVVDVVAFLRATQKPAPGSAATRLVGRADRRNPSVSATDRVPARPIHTGIRRQPLSDVEER